VARIEEQELDIPNRDAEIIPLGTGSSVPSKYRNVSATLIRVPGIGNYLLDCGEGTLGQIRRLFDAEEATDILRNMRCIVISHVHADHHMGTPSLIKAWYEQTLKDNSNATLAISCIGRYRVLLEELSQIEDIGFHRLRFPSCPFPKEKDRDLTTKEDLGDENFGLASIKRVPVPHCWRSFGTQLELTSGLKIAYSGDCRPSKLFAQECRGAHLLVHECTFGDDKQDHAKAKKHSTMGEALGVAREMEARRTLLTHFSQRYSKSDSLKRDRVEGVEHDVLLAFDFMAVKLGDFQKAACYLPSVQRFMEKLAD
jgi:ribonuclease Z